jgi:hypothetical protein
MRFRVCAAVGIAACFFAVNALAAGNDPATAREQLKIGYQLKEAGKCEEAIPHLAESLRLDARAITLINLADCEEKTGKLSDAMVHWVDARSRAQAEGMKPIEEEATTRAAALDAKVPRLTVTLAKSAPADAKVERDGAALGAPSLGVALPVDPGAHTITVKAPGHQDATKQITIAEGEKQALEVDVGPAGAGSTTTAPPPVKTDDTKGGGGVSPLVFIGFGVAVVGVGVGSVTGIMALGKGSDAKTACPNKVCNSASAKDDADSGKTVGTISTIAFIAGGVGAAVGVVGLLTGGKKTEGKVDVGIGPSNIVLRGRF